MSLSHKRKIQKTNTFTRDLKKLTDEVKNKAYETAIILAKDPFDEGLNIKQLTGFKKIFRVVILADFRMVYTFDKENLFLLKISHRKEIYKNFEL
jgi:mRNA-degrading endonuclease RelE of RelBE toxin-antitoxin system